MINREIAEHCKKGHDFLERVKERPIMRLNLREVEYLQEIFSFCRCLALEIIK